MKLKENAGRGIIVLSVMILLAAGWLWGKLNAPVVQYQTLIVRPGGVATERTGDRQTGCVTQS